MHTATTGFLVTRLRLDSIEKLPTLPVVALRLLELTEDEFCSPRDVAALIETDPPLAAKTLKLANSAFYGYPTQIASIRDALLLVGFNAVRSTVLTLSIHDLLQERPASTGFDRGAFWLHCLGCAVCCRQVIERNPTWASRAEEAFLSGLFHDIGKLIFDQYLPREYEQVLSMASTRGTSLAEAEWEILGGVDHASVGAELLRLWNIPPHLVDAVAQHHRAPPESLGAHPAALSLAAIVRFADAVMQCPMGDRDGIAASPDIDPAFMTALGIVQGDVARMASEASRMVRDMAAVFGIRTAGGNGRRPIGAPSPAANARLNTWKELDERYRDLFETSKEAIFLLGDLILDCNHQACRLLGCERKDLIDGPFGAFLPPVQPDGTPSDHRLREQMTAALDGSDPTFHLQLSKRDGSAVDAEVCLKTISVTGTPVIRMRVRDVGRRKRLQRAWRRIHKQLRSAEAERQRGEETLKSLHEELETQVQERTRELERAYEEMKRLDSMKTAFLSLASHELRTPLTSIRSFSEILLHYDEDPETRKEFLEVIHTESERLTRLINDVLDMSRIEAGKLIYHDEPLEIDRIIQEVARTQKSLLEEKSLRLILEVPSDLPAVLADGDRIQQVVINLLGNAIKFSHPGKEITIRADCLKGKRTGDPKTWVRVSVTDQGIGIDKESLGSIFEKFYQVCSQDTLDDKPRGTGLGLPICKEIITHYNGRIWADSEKDNGSTFHFTLPAGNGSGADAP